jgi:hypothetical protein
MPPRPDSPYSPNFAFLAEYGQHLASLPTDAERVLWIAARSALQCLRSFGEALAKQVVKDARLPEVSTQQERLDLLLRRRMVDKEVYNCFDVLRKDGNRATHEFSGDFELACEALETAHALGVWFENTFGRPSRSVRRYVAPRRVELIEADRRVRLEQAAERLRDFEQLNAIPSFDIPLIWEEQRRHLAAFVGRERDLTALRNHTATLCSGYLLLTGERGLGKSALLARLAQKAPHQFKAPADSAWPDLVLYHSGKCGDTPRRILQFLLWQAGRHLGQQLSSACFERSIAEMRAQLIDVLGMLSSKNHGVLLVIDALDEIVGDRAHLSRALAFLPDSLPDGVRCVLSSRPDQAIIDHVRVRLGVAAAIRLGPMTDEDTSLFLSSQFPERIRGRLEDRELVEEIMSRTGGIPLLLRHLARRAEEECRRAGSAGAVLRSDWIPDSLEAVFRDVYREGVEGKGPRGHRLRQRVIALLAEANGGLTVGEVHAALKQLGHSVEHSSVRDALNQIASVAVNFGGGVYSLYHAGFAEHVRASLGADERAEYHRALAGADLEGLDDVEVRFASHCLHLRKWYTCAATSGLEKSLRKAAAAVVRSVLRPKILAGVFATRQEHDLIEFLSWASTAIVTVLPEHQREQLAEWEAFLNRELGSLVHRPCLFRQLAMNSASAIVTAGATELPPDGSELLVLFDTGNPDPGLVRTYPVDVRDFEQQYLLMWEMHELRSALCYLAARDLVMVNDRESVSVWRVGTGRRLWRRDRLTLRDPVAMLSPCGDFVALAERDYDPFDAIFGDGGNPAETRTTESRIGLSLFAVQTGREEWTVAPGFLGDRAALAIDQRGGRVLLATTSGRVVGHETVALRALDLRTGACVAEALPDSGIAPILNMVAGAVPGSLFTVGWRGPVDGGDSQCQLIRWNSDTFSVERIERLAGSSQPVGCVPGDEGVAWVACTDGILLEVHLESMTVRTHGFDLGRIVALYSDPATRDLNIYYIDREDHVARFARWSSQERRPVGLLCIDAERVWSLANAGSKDLYLVLDGAGMQLRFCVTEPLSSARKGRPGQERIVAVTPDLRHACFWGGSGAPVIRDFASPSRTSGALPVPAASQPGHREVPLWISDRVAHSPDWHVRLSAEDVIVLLDDSDRGVGGHLVLVRGTPETVERVALHGARVTAMELSADGSRLALVVHPSPNVRPANPAGQMSATVSLDPSELEQFFLELREVELVVVALDGVGVCYRWRGTPEEPEVTISPDGQWVAVREHNGELVLHAPGRSGSPLPVPAPRINAVSDRFFSWDRVVFFPAGGSVFAVGSSPGVRVGVEMDLAMGTVRRRMENAPAGAFAVTLDGRHLVCVEADGISLRTVETGEERAHFPASEVAAVCVRDEGRIALVTQSGRLRVLEIIEQSGIPAEGGEATMWG